VVADDTRLVLDFLNTLNVEEGVAQLATEDGWLAWTKARQLHAGSRTHARKVRETLRAAVGDPEAQAGELAEPVNVSLTRGLPTLSARDAVGAVLAASARLAIREQWDRVKICPVGTCRWAFFDLSRNRSRTWCSMRLCGNREKARAWRERVR
jgi:predicted RNA-binding Zn ribbon-like protein